MATQVSSPAGVSHKVKAGVAPLRAGQGHSFFWRRLHSLSGIVPVGAFLFEHILVSNATAMNGPEAYANQVKFLGSLPLVIVLEAVGIWIPILYHGLYGFYIWYRGDTNVGEYPWQGNWMYTVQRWTGALVFFYIGWHVWHLRFAGIDLHAHPGASFGKVQMELFNSWQFAFYVVALICASWHFSYGIWLFCAKWGIAQGERARKRLLIPCMALFVVMTGVGLGSIAKFRSMPQQPADESADQLRTAPAPPTPPVDQR
jgi:succinate dehydrogenase / fumarate reductase cytochrome b subunit